MGHDEFFRKRKALTRLQNTRTLRRILIVCEGEKTEPNYFRKFPENPEVYDRIDIHGTGYNTVSLVNEAIRLKNEALKKREPYIEVWCVFDKDDFSTEHFIQAPGYHFSQETSLSRGCLWVCLSAGMASSAA
jgi:hypothetical protein